MATDATGRRGWALLGSTDWTPHAWVVALSFPRSTLNSTSLLGVCEVQGTSAEQVGRLWFHSSLSPSSPWFLSSPNGLVPAYVVTVTVPPYNPHASGVPTCVLTNVSTVSDPGFAPNALPPYSVGTDKRGSPLLLSAAINPSNSSQINVTTWSALTGSRTYSQTWACGSPSYLYACPDTSGANWPMSGLFNLALSNGTLLLGGGDWSAQQYFQATLPALAEGEEGVEGEALGAAPLPVLAFLNSSSQQGTWLARPNSFLWAPTPGKWPVYVNYLQAAQGGCNTATGYSSSLLLTSTTSGGGTLNTSYSGGTYTPSCPLRSGDAPWIAGAACLGAAVGVPDLMWA